MVLGTSLGTFTHALSSRKHNVYDITSASGCNYNVSTNRSVWGLYLSDTSTTTNGVFHLPSEPDPISMKLRPFVEIYEFEKYIVKTDSESSIFGLNL